ncbi:HlyD family type I secretion periplasmic adaptor subunit [Hydrogenophaga sp. A37]|uniref:HlyD family type I secretion periplasmic adaptor subunit n=1 Tax=Hydrogenophaga sp. A37 TaxID=1945864 RepID=UPI000984695A|nr:HlyD family type I secretion periplasmic adaptor subunit [Hydrogenophaga sp. A37]OOG79571.1 hemolysin secretion protein D [Hydrogenophaga sp. A37]
MGVRLQALGDLLQRYGAVWRHAWQHRKEMEPEPRQPHEAQFLPAALSLQETPVSPAPRVAMWLIIAFALLALLWSIFGQIDVVATAQGKIVPNDRTKTIQPFETASVRAIRVTDGQAVKAGDVLIELDPTSARADVDRVRSELSAARLQVARSKAVLATFDGAGRATLVSPEGVDESSFQEAQSLLEGQLAEYAAKQSRIDAEIAQRVAELNSTQELVAKLEQTLPIAQQRAQNYKNLVDKNFVSKHGYLDREQARIEQQADLASQKSRLQELGAAIRQARSQRTELSAETRRIHLDSVTEGQQKIAALEQEQLKADARNRLTTLTSPVDGTVQQLAIHTVGGVVTPAQALMIVVPHDANMEVEAFLENKDIGFVHPKQEAEIKVETFQYTKYGTIHAEVASVSRDAISDEKLGLIYATRLRMTRSDIQVDGVPVTLSPGMAVSVEIKTGRRRIIEYFLAPLMRGASESLRER